ncbi:MAG: biotin carboxylase N-terminal domain-containing protein [Mycobacteriales bacterium]
MFSRVAIVNRAEPAVRLIRAVRELNAQYGYGIRTVALHTAAERAAMFVREADEAVQLRSEAAAGSPYLDHAELERALRAAGADAAWVGWGFVAEDPAFAELCERLGIVFVGPPPEAMRRLGDKIEAKRLAEQVGVPVAPWSGGPVESLAEATRSAEHIGYPLMIKARSGGGGRGIRVVSRAEELAEAFERTQAEAARSFGDPVVFLERRVPRGRHIEVQVIADAFGTVWPVGVRDCSVQRRNQKLLEESGSPVLTPEQVADLKKSSGELVRAAGYRNAGTVEFLYQPEERAFSFLEVNTRLQVEHPVTEATTGLDLVKLQLLVANGERLVGEPPPGYGYAVEARLNAEDPDRGFAPAPGTVALLRLPSGPGVRVDSGIAAGDVISADYDSMVAKVIGWGRNREEAYARLRRALAETTVVVEGGTTNKAFLLHLLDQPEVIDGTADTGWLDRDGAARTEGPAPHASVALLAVAVDVYDAEEAWEREAFLAAARGGRPRARHTVARPVDVRYAGTPYRFSVSRTGPSTYRVDVDGRPVEVEVDRLAGPELRLSVGGRRHHVMSVQNGPDHLVEVDGVSHRVSRDEGGLVRAPAPAVVVATRVGNGDSVDSGAALVVLESMKMETVVTAPYAGYVRDVFVAAGTQVDVGAPLLKLELLADRAAQTDAPLVSFELAAPESARDGHGEADRALAALQARITGYDVSADETTEQLRRLDRAHAAVGAADPQLLAGELQVLRVYADLCELSRNRPADGEESSERVHSPREFFHAYLHSLDVEREGLPERFRVRLSRALAHYGVDDQTDGPELEAAVYRAFLALELMESQAGAVTALLERWLSAPPSLPEQLPEQLREHLQDVVERLVATTALRYPVVGDLARSVRFRFFDQPLIEQARARTYDAVREHLKHLTRNPDTPDYAERVAVLVASPEPIIRFLSERLGLRGRARQPMLEVITRRYYKLRGLQDLRAYQVDDRPFVTAGYDLDGERLQLVATLADISELSAALSAVASAAGQADTTARLVGDVYLAWDDPPGEDEMAAHLLDVLTGAAVPAGVRRVTVAASSAGGADLRTFTFRPSADGFVEDRVIRGLHPLIAHRLDFWRLANFDVTRLPAPEDVYLFRCVARDNADDERLVALAEVRDVTQLRDASGRLAALPAVERILASCVDSIRRAQAQFPAARLAEANRVFLYSWPSVEVPPEELMQAARALAPLTAGAGLEQVMMLARLVEQKGESPRDVAVRVSYQPGTGLRLTVADPPTYPMPTMDAYEQKVRRARARGNVYPYELVPLLTGDAGTFVEHDLDGQGRLVPVDRPPGGNSAGIVAGVVTTPTRRHPEGMTRVAMFGDPTRALGSVAEPECARVVAAIDLAEQLGVPIEWFALSSGAKISMDSGTENMDWVARALRRIITFTQAGGEINVVVAGINVGAQPYWNAEATMLQHTRGILVMTPESAMVLTGKQSLDYSGGVSAEDNFGIGGYDRVMGPNGQAQYWAPDLARACEVLFAHYDHTYVVPGERFPRRARTSDPVGRDVGEHPHVFPGSDFTTVGDIFSNIANPERKKAFDIRTLLRAVADQDHPPLERWSEMAEAETSVVLDAHLGGYPVTLLGVESRPVPRRGKPPADGPDTWTAGTLFPRSSKKTARAINAASGNRPLVVLANLSGFDGSPESLRNLQLEYGAEIGRAIVNFDGPIVFCVVSRYHGGAFVVFSGALHDGMEVLAVEGSYASVIGGAPAAAVVFAGEVKKRTETDPLVRELQAAVAAADDTTAAHLRVELAELRSATRAAKISEVAIEFDRVHSIERAQQVGSVHRIIPAVRLRQELVEAVERGIERTRAGQEGEQSTLRYQAEDPTTKE